MFHGYNKNLIQKIDNLNRIKSRLNKESHYKYILKNKSYSLENSKNNLNISRNFTNNKKRNNYNICKYKKISKIPSLPSFGVDKHNSVDIIYENEKYKIITNKIEQDKEKRNKIIKIPRFNYSCCLDKNNMFCLKYYKPKENIKKKTIKFIYQLNNIKSKKEYKKPRMINILEKNNKIYYEVFSQPWKYPEIFKNE